MTKKETGHENKKPVTKQETGHEKPVILVFQEKLHTLFSSDAS